MTPQGKGIFLWQIKRVAGGDPNAIAEFAKAAQLTHVVIKVADGKYNYNISNGVDMVPALVASLRAHGIQPWGWQYVYGSNPSAEAKKAIERVKQFNLSGFVVNAEGQFKANGMNKVAKNYMKELRNGLPGLPIGLSTYRYPTIHTQFPFTAFLDYCNFSMPQVYWIDSKNPGQQLKRSVSEYQALKPAQPVVPTGSAFTYGTWAATPQQLVDFLAAARQLNLPGVNFWEMATAQDNDGSLWSVIKDYNWATGSFNTPTPNPTPAPSPAPSPNPVPNATPAPQPSPKPDIITRYLAALNNGNPNQPTVLYEKNVSKHINAGKLRQGRMAIFEWYNTLLKKTLPNAKFSIVSKTKSGNTFQLKWSAKSSKGKVQNGKDTIVMSSTNPNLILHHVTEFSVSKSISLGPVVITWEPSEIGSMSE